METYLIDALIVFLALSIIYCVHKQEKNKRSDEKFDQHVNEALSNIADPN